MQHTRPAPSSARSDDPSFARYFAQICAQPYLDADAERDLARRWRERGDPQAANALVRSHLRLVAKMANGFKGYGLPLADLVSEGNVGLMQAIAKFDPDKGVRFATYAAWWIRAAITDYVLLNWSLVTLSRNDQQKRLFFHLRRLKRKLGEDGSGDMAPRSVAAIAEALEVSEQYVVEMNRRLAGPEASLNARVGEDGAAEWQDLLADERPSHADLIIEADDLAWRGRLLREALADLPERDRLVFTRRRLTENPPSLQELGAELGISHERVRQLEARAYEKVQARVTQLARARRCGATVH